MKLKSLRPIGRRFHLHNHELLYENNAGETKSYEMVSHNRLQTKEDLGGTIDGVIVIAVQDDKMLLLREFRMAINRYVYGFCSGMVNENEPARYAAIRELREETGLEVKEFLHQGYSSFPSPAISDTRIIPIFVKTKGAIKPSPSPNEEITAAFYTRDEVKHLLKSGEQFDTKAQMAAYFFAYGT